MPAAIRRTLAIFAAMAVGACIPGAHVLSPALSWLIAGNLLLSACSMRWHRQMVTPRHALILAVNLALPLVLYAVLRPVDERLAVAAFLVAITPTAIAAPILTHFLGGRVSFVIVSVILTNVGVAVMIPFLLPLVSGTLGAGHAGLTVWAVLRPTCLVVLVPLVLAAGLRRWAPAISSRLASAKNTAFALWLAIIAVISARSSFFLFFENHASAGMVAQIAALSAVLCVGQFQLGRLLGGKHWALEAGQSLGQKNNGITIWIGLSFLNPLVALGPTFYVVWHNCYNAWQILRYRPPDPPNLC